MSPSFQVSSSVADFYEPCYERYVTEDTPTLQLLFNYSLSLTYNMKLNIAVGNTGYNWKLETYGWQRIRCNYVILQVQFSCTFFRG